MTEQQESKGSQAESPATASDCAIEKRRRLLKLGASAAPLVMTLASRSALACHCKSPSAIGSVTNISHRPKEEVDSGFNIAGQVKTYGSWMDQYNLPGGVTKTTPICNIPTIGSAFSGDYTKIKNLPAGFNRDIVTAFLNLSNSPEARSNCLTVEKLGLMAKGSYIDPVSGVSFNSKGEIQTYLSSNYLLG